MPLTDEQMSKLPYQEKPADALDVAKEITTLASLVAGIVSGGMRYASNAEHAAQSVAKMLEDTTKEPGQAVVVQQTRVALALESWAGERDTGITKIILEGLQEVFGEAFVALHTEAHKPPIPMGPVDGG